MFASIAESKRFEKSIQTFDDIRLLNLLTRLQDREPNSDKIQVILKVMGERKRLREGLGI